MHILLFLCIVGWLMTPLVMRGRPRMRDPFYLLEEQSSDEQSLDDLRVLGTLLCGEERVALIEGPSRSVVVRPGERFEGYTIQAITSTTVTVQQGNETKCLSLAHSS